MNAKEQMQNRLKNQMKERDTHVPLHLQEGLVAYIIDGRPPGDFLYYLLCNDLTGAIMHGDPVSIMHLKTIMVFIYNYAPGGCWRSKESVNAWIKFGGMAAVLEKKEGSHDSER